MTKLLFTTSLFAMMAYAAESGGAAGEAVAEEDTISDDEGKSVKLQLTAADLTALKELQADLPNWTKEDILHFGYNVSKKEGIDIHESLKEGVGVYRQTIQNFYGGDVEAFRKDQAQEPRPNFTIANHPDDDAAAIAALVAMMAEMGFDDDDYDDDLDDYI